MIAMTQEPRQAGLNIQPIAIISNVFASLVASLGKYYSACLDKEISHRQSLLITQSNLLFTLAAFPADYSLLLRAAFALWFAYSLLACKRAGV